MFSPWMEKMNTKSAKIYIKMSTKNLIVKFQAIYQISVCISNQSQYQKHLLLTNLSHQNLTINDLYLLPVFKTRSCRPTLGGCPFISPHCHFHLGLQRSRHLSSLRENCPHRSLQFFKFSICFNYSSLSL